MASSTILDAVIVGSGPNGLAAAIELARAGRSVLVLEANRTIGGGVRSAELTLPGFVHDICAAAFPFVVGSPFLRSVPLAAHGLRLVQPPAPLAHALDERTAVVLERSVRATAAGLGRDGAAYVRLMAPLVAAWDRLVTDLLGPLRWPRYPLPFARFGMLALRSAVSLATATFRGEAARALFGGMAAHSMLSLESPLSAAFGLVLGMLAHAVGWPFARGGAQAIADALAGCGRALGCQIVTDRRVRMLADLPPSRAVLFDLGARGVLSVTGDRLPAGYRRQLARYRYGSGVFKMDWALDGPIPWRAAGCARAGTVHLGGTLAEVAASERSVWRGRDSPHPFVLLTQPSCFDPSRAPAGKHTAWAYCHVPNGSTVDMADRIEAQVERFAPGFRDRILARSALGPADMERHNANYLGGDINGGVQDLVQHFARPAPRLVPYATPDPRLYVCSSSTPPGGGVHGMCGQLAARAALRRSFSAR